MLSNRTLGHFLKFQGLCGDSVRADRQFAASAYRFSEWLLADETSETQSIEFASAVEIASQIETSITRLI